MESTDLQLRKQIHQLERLQNSQQGNPKYRVQFTDGTPAETATDSSIAFVITNSEYRAGDVLVTFNSRGKIINVEPIADKVALAKQLLEAHDARLAARASEPPSDDEGLPHDSQAWLTWHNTVSGPAYAAWKAAMDAFRAAVPHDGIGSGRHPLNFRPECEAIIAAAARDAAAQQ